jgi:hypothetical protein
MRCSSVCSTSCASPGTHRARGCPRGALVRRRARRQRGHGPAQRHAQAKQGLRDHQATRGGAPTERGELEGRVMVENANVSPRRFAQSCDGRDGWPLKSSRSQRLQAKMGVRCASAFILLYVHWGIYTNVNSHPSLWHHTSAQSRHPRECRGRSRHTTSSRSLATARCFSGTQARAQARCCARCSLQPNQLGIQTKGKGGAYPRLRSSAHSLGLLLGCCVWLSPKPSAYTWLVVEIIFRTHVATWPPVSALKSIEESDLTAFELMRV